MSDLTSPQLEMARLIIDTLNLEDIEPGEIEAEAPLFREGLGLDSIDALELSLAIKQKYGVQLKAEEENVVEIFSSLSSLSAYVQAKA